MTRSWEYRPVRDTKTGSITIREVYYNKENEICYIEQQSIMTYYPEVDKCIDTLKLHFPMVQEMNKYNPDLIDYVDETKLAEFSFPVSEK